MGDLVVLLSIDKGTFAETANGDNRLSFAEQRKQTSVFRLQQTNGSYCFPVAPFPVNIYIYIETTGYISPLSFVGFFTKKQRFCPFPKGLNGQNGLAHLTFDNGRFDLMTEKPCQAKGPLFL